MNASHYGYPVIGLMAVIALTGTFLAPGPAGYISLLLAGIFAVVYRQTLNQPDRVFYYACAGVLLVASCAAVSVWEGLAVGWLVAAVILGSLGVPVTSRDIPAVAAGGLVTTVVAFMIQSANHVLLPLMVFCIAAAGVLGILAVRNYRFRKEYSGVRQ